MNISRCALVVALGWSVLSSLTASAQVAPTAPSQSEPLVTLSPFILSENQDTGYAPTETLSGTRLRTAVKDVASAMTIVTGDLMKDLGALNYADVLDFVPSTTTYANTADDANSNGPRSGTPFVVRGYRSGSISTNFFTSFTKPDAYNMSRLTFTRGPNSILFSIGNPGGAIDATTNKADLRRASHTLDLRVDSFDGFRTAFDSNIVIVPPNSRCASMCCTTTAAASTRRQRTSVTQFSARSPRCSRRTLCSTRMWRSRNCANRFPGPMKRSTG